MIFEEIFLRFVKKGIYFYFLFLIFFCFNISCLFFVSYFFFLFLIWNHSPGSVQMVGTTAEGLQSDYTRIRELEHDGLFELLKQ